jgi:hypothetical protein
MRKFDDLSPQDKGVYIVREEIKKAQADSDNEQPDKNIQWAYEQNIFRYCITICNECLDIATLGEIEK